MSLTLLESHMTKPSIHYRLVPGCWREVGQTQAGYTVDKSPDLTALTFKDETETYDLIWTFLSFQHDLKLFESNLKRDSSPADSMTISSPSRGAQMINKTKTIIYYMKIEDLKIAMIHLHTKQPIIIIIY